MLLFGRRDVDLLKTNSVIFSKGSIMKNFYKKALYADMENSFKKIYFY